jgi:hypothetical protein
MTLDFTILDTNSPRTLALMDGSDYGGPVVSASVVVTIPGFSAVTVPISPNKVTVMNSNTLGLSAVTTVEDLAELPDGIYKISFTHSAQNVTKTFMRVEKLRCSYENAILSGELSDMKHFMEIEFLIQSSIASANICNHDLAVELYRQASKEIARLLD